MIFVTVGTNETPFDRLVEAAAELPGTEDVLVQYGSSRTPFGRGDWRDFLAFEAMEAAMRDARVVVTHAGTGSILLAHKCGRRPIVMPRLRALGEAVDDHQLTLAHRLAGTGTVTVVETTAELIRAVGAVAAAPTLAALPGPLRPAATVALAKELERYLAAIVNRKAGAASLPRLRIADTTRRTSPSRATNRST